MMRLLPAEWLPKADMKRVILHWTGGGYKVSALDRLHYHLIIDGDARVHRGVHSIKANERLRGVYAAHTRGCNTGSIGIAVCAMAGAVEEPFRLGKFPMKQAQVDRMVEAVAQLCRVYKIPVTPKTVLSHAEVQATLGIPQLGKWDIAWLPTGRKLIGARAVGEYFRFNVQRILRSSEN
jgi:N-acetyl-anhydromuramyl-L-alanine amidase AmpD